MKSSNRRITLCTIFIVCNLLFIWGNSLLPAEASNALSNFARWVLSFLTSGGPPEDPSGGTHFLRKLAHFSEFACLGALLTWRFSMRPMGGFVPIVSSLLCGVLAACVDEFIQIFSPGRHCSVLDVGIDSAGVFTGTLLLLLVYTIIIKHKKRSQEETKP